MSQRLVIEAEAAAAIVRNIRDLAGDDEDLLSDMVEGETGFHDALRSIVARVGEIKGHVEGLKAHMDALSKRKQRLEDQADNLRAVIDAAMCQADLKKVELDIATVSRRTTAPTLTVTDESAVPSSYWLPQPPKLDKRALLQSLKNKEAVPGAVLSNGGETVSLRFI